VKNPTENPGGAGKEKNRFYLIGIVAVAGLVILAAVVLQTRKTAATGSELAKKQGETAGIGPAKTAAGKDSSTGTPGQSDAKAAPFAEQLKVMANLTLPTSERRKVAEALAEDGSAAAVAALKKAFANGSEDMRVAIAEALGKCASPECTQWLFELLQDPSVLVARGAVRALAGQDTPEAAGALARMMQDDVTAADLRCEIALSLGDMNQPGVVQALTDMTRLTDNEDLVAAALTALGGRDFAETESFFRTYLQSPDVSQDLRAQTVEALAQAKGDPSPFLAELAANDKDPDVRAAAAWAMSATEANGKAGTELLALLQNEKDADVRLRLYQALGNQESFDPATALALVKNEKDPSARVAGLDLLAQALRENPTSQLQNYFNQTAIPELKQLALTGPTPSDRQAAVIALTRAQTPEAMAALNDLAAQMAAQKNAAAQQAADQKLAAKQAADQKLAAQQAADQKAAARRAAQQAGQAGRGGNVPNAQ
jgi:HEAT repeat protein